MRFLSKAQNFKISAVKAEQTLINTARGPEQIESKHPFIAHFKQGGVSQSDIRKALERFQFKGLGEGEDPSRRISIFDTDEEAYLNHWTPEFKAEVEQGLLKGQNEYYFLVEADPTAIPWASYHETPAANIADLAVLTGASLEQVLAYEAENENRPEVIADLRDKTAVSEDVEVSA